MNWKFCCGVATALFLSFTALTKGAGAEGAWPPDGTYHYDILLNGTAIAHSDVVITSGAESISVEENLQQGAVRVTTAAQYSIPGVSLVSYSADVPVPGGSQHTTVTVKPGVFTVSVPGQTVAINADPTAPLLIVGDNFVGTMAMTPAILHAAGAKSFTLAVLRGGKALVASVQSAGLTSRPGTVPPVDIGIDVAFGALHEVFWYNPKTFVVDEVKAPAQSMEVQLTSHPAPTPFPTSVPHFSSRDIAFESADGTRLAGTITIPDNATASLPAVVLVHGSGPEDRNETIGPNPVFLQLSNALSNAGYVVLRYDKRGIGLSGGSPDSSRDDLITDATAALDFLRKQPEVDPQRVFMLGHSEGGELVPTVAARHPVLAGIVLMAPPALPLWQVVMQQVLASVPPDKAQLTKQQELTDLQAVRDGSLHSPGMLWLRTSMDIDPIADIKRVRCPILILQGASDVQVLAKDLPRLISAARSTGQDITSYVFPNDNHLFMNVTPGEPHTPQAALHQYLTVPGEIDPHVLSVLISWLNDPRSAPPHPAWARK